MPDAPPRSETTFPGRRIALLIDASSSMLSALPSTTLAKGAPNNAAFFTTVGAARYFIEKRMAGKYRDLMALIEFGAQLFFDPIPSMIEQIKGGRLRAMAVTSTARAEALPDVPSMSDFLPGFEANGWQGIGVPANTPTEIVEKLNKALNQVLATDEVRRRLAVDGAEPLPGTPEEYGADLDREERLWGKVVKAIGIEPE